jgi:large subunit ribosomal protein L10
MRRNEKEDIINEIADKLSNCTIVIATDYRGLTAKEMVQLRRNLRELGIEYRVSKNTLTRFATDKAGKDQLKQLLTGPVAFAFGYDDVIKPAKVLNDYVRSAASVLKIKGGMIGDRVISADEITALANTPPYEVLVAQFIGQLRTPVQGLHNVLSAPVRQLLGVIQSIIQQLEGG